MRLAWYSNAPNTCTGYGTQTEQVVRRMAADGHEVHILANYGQIAGVGSWDGAQIVTPAASDVPVRVWPQGHSQYSLDVVDDQADMIDPDIVFTLYDVWVLQDAWKDRRVISWTPIDHYPPTPGVLKWAKRHETIAMSEFGARALRESDIEPIDMIWHGIERDTFTPTDSPAREKMHASATDFVITIPAANIGVTPPRKQWAGMLEAVARLMHRHDDVRLFLHTDLHRPGNGLPIPDLMKSLGMPTDRVSVVPPVLYRGGLVSATELAQLYTASDVVLLTTKGEGFGIPVVEAMATGTPSIVSDFSAQPELVEDTGWKVPVQLDYDHYQGSFFATTFTIAILEALEQAYQERGTPAAQQRREACIERARLFDADTLYAEHWRPLLERLADEQKPRPAKSNAAKRRAKKAATA